MKVIKLMAVVLMFAGCAAVTQETIDYRQGRADQILADRKMCSDNGGRIVVQRRGGVTRAQAAENIVGRWDTWYCDDDWLD